MRQHTRIPGDLIMRAMILAAGVGSRLDPLTRNCPKPLVPIVNRPVMEYLILLLKQHGFHDIMVNVHYLGDQIAQYFGDGSNWGVNIHWSHEDELWGDAGSVKRVQEFFQNETFLVIGGDDLTDMDLTAVVQTHKSKQATATLALSVVDDPSEYGIVQLNDDGPHHALSGKAEGRSVLQHGQYGRLRVRAACLRSDPRRHVLPVRQAAVSPADGAGTADVRACHAGLLEGRGQPQSVPRNANGCAGGPRKRRSVRCIRPERTSG